MRDERNRKRSLISKAKKNKINREEFAKRLKYEFDQKGRDYILSKLDTTYTNNAYNNPLPQSKEELCKIECKWSGKTSELHELFWYFDVISRYSNEINLYLKYNEQIECSILNGNYEQAIGTIDSLEEVCVSLFSLQTRFYINEKIREGHLNKELIQSLPYNETSQKVLFLLEYNRLKLDGVINYSQFDSILKDHKKVYSPTSTEIFNYIDFKLNPLHYGIEYENIEFLLYYDSDFSIIDRYRSLKEIIPILLSQKRFNSESLILLGERVKVLEKSIADPYWAKLLMILGRSTQLELSTRTELYFRIQDQFYNANYIAVIEECESVLMNNPNHSEIYIFYVKALIFIGKGIEVGLDTTTELYSIINNLYKLLLKEKNYNSSRNRLIDYFYKISHFDFGISILEFLFNEFGLEIPSLVKTTSYLKTQTIRYNSYSQFSRPENFANLKILDHSEVFRKIKEYLQLTHEKTGVPNSFFKFKILVGVLIHKERYDQAITYLEQYKEDSFESKETYRFIETWIDKKLLRCYFKQNDFSKIADLIVNTYFRHETAYDHYYDQKLIEVFSDLDFQEGYYSNLSIPILFEIYNQSQASIYDRIADFLIANDLKLPSNIIEIEHKFPRQHLVHFLENVCTKENIQDSPFLNTVSNLEDERITILNFLKSINTNRTERYNAEILEITQAASWRQGLLQIHESRIYIDRNNIEKVLASKLQDTFERYLGFNDIEHSTFLSIRLGSSKEEIKVLTFYLKDPVQPSDSIGGMEMGNAEDVSENYVLVPYIRTTYFKEIFKTIRNEYVHNEDYGFKSFLSMRIRHGTFRNVLRSVFDKHNLIATRSSDENIYLDIDHWEFGERLNPEIQNLLKDFSAEIDHLIDESLAWINVKTSNDQDHVFDFDFQK